MNVAPNPEGEQNVRRLQPLRVLLSGRDRRFLRVTSFLLAQRGYDVQETSPRRTLESVERHHSDVVLLETNDSLGAVREFQALIAMKPIDVAGSHYNLAKAYQAAGRKDQAREEAVTALEAAPNYKPAQKLLLEVSEGEK